MLSIQLKEISVSFGAKDCLKDVDLSFMYGDRLALTGANGSGKSTLMKIMFGVLKPDAGTVIKSKEARIAYLPQSQETFGDATLMEETEKAFHAFQRLKTVLAGLETKISGLEKDSSRLEPLLHQHHDLFERLEQSGYFMREKRKEQVLSGLGFKPEDFNRACSSFSLGWQMRIALAGVLLQNPDFLLLDEPTNYLDLEARTWLLDFLRNFFGGVILVSHDRFFLDNTVKAVAELFSGKLRVYKGNYSHYEEVRSREMEQLIEKHRQVMEERERSEAFIRRFRAQASKAALVQSRIKQLEKLAIIEIPAGVKKIHISFPAPPHSGKRTLFIEGLAKDYAGKIIFSGVDLEIMRGEKIVVVGSNGAGKSTLLRLVAGVEAPSRGSISFGDGVEAGYFCADAPFQAQETSTVLDTIEEIAPTELYPRLRTLLGAFLFQGDDAFKPVGVLSGGEQSRLLLLKQLLNPKNLLILDEPTNHLDMASKDVLLEALRLFPGTVMFVSHDRAFIEGLAHRVIEMREGKALLYNGDYRYYLWKKEMEGEQGQSSDAAATIAAAEDSAVKGRQDHESLKRTRNTLKKIEREETALLARIETLQQANKDREFSLARDDVYRDGNLVRQIKNDIENNEHEEYLLFSRWEELEQEKRAIEREDG